MNAFSLWFSTGYSHILDPAAYDHLMFVCLLALSFPAKEWKKLLILVTAFTAGHSITLALSVISEIALPSTLVEFSIALSILLTGLVNFSGTSAGPANRPAFIYTLTLLFGLLHGLGFSFLLRAMLGAEQKIVPPLLYFNLGIELGQLTILAAVFLIYLFLSSVFRLSFRYFKFITVCIITLIALKITADRFLLLLA